jgi:osmotically-inducible protein OsmY
MRFIRTLATLALVAVVCVLAYNYWAGQGFTLTPQTNTTGIDVERATERGTALANKAAEQAGKAAQKTGEAVTQVEGAIASGTLTAKIKSKMALDDTVKARTINVDTSGSVVTLSGVVATPEERTRAIRLAEETDGVTRVVDQLEVRRP